MARASPYAIGRSGHRGVDHQASRLVDRLLSGTARREGELDHARLTYWHQAPQGARLPQDVMAAWWDTYAEGQRRKGKLPAAETPRASVSEEALIRVHRATPCPLCLLSPPTCPIEFTANLAATVVLPFRPGARPALRAAGTRQHRPPPDSETRDTLITDVVDHLLTGAVRHVSPDTPIVRNLAFVDLKAWFHPTDPGALEQALAGPVADVAERFRRFGEGVVAEVLAQPDAPGEDAHESRQAPPVPTSPQSPLGATAAALESGTPLPSPPSTGPGPRVRLRAALLARALARRVTVSKPRLVHSLAGVINDSLTAFPFYYTTVEEMLAFCKANSWFASVDLKQGFHHALIHPDDQPYLGFDVRHTDGRALSFVWTRLVMGLKVAPAAFSWLTGEMTSTLNRRACHYALPGGVHIFAYVDDIFIFADSKEACEAAFVDLTHYCDSVGARLAADKCRPPAQRGPILGLELDLRSASLALPREKRFNTAAQLSVILAAARVGAEVPARAVHKLAGKLYHASSVVVGGRAHLASLWGTLGGADATKPDRSRYVTVAGPELQGDLEWWLAALADEDRCRERLLINPFGSAASWATVLADASGDGGCGLVAGDMALWASWPRVVAAEVAIQPKELYPLALWLEHFGHLLAGMSLLYLTDNLGNMYALNKGYTSEPEALPVLRRILDACDRHRIMLVTAWWPRDFNTVADAISKCGGLQNAVLLWEDEVRARLGPPGASHAGGAGTG
jgi:hypothetical protein